MYCHIEMQLLFQSSVLMGKGGGSVLQEKLLGKRQGIF